MPFQGPEIIILIIIALLIFGPKKLPEMGAAIGKSIKEFKKSVTEPSMPKSAEDEQAPSGRGLEEETVPQRTDQDVAVNAHQSDQSGQPRTMK